jgi:hypothetical protein
MDIEKIVFYKESNILIVEGANFKGFNLIEWVFFWVEQLY